MMVSSLDEIRMGARFLRGLPAFLRHPVTVDEARARLRQRLERRCDDFLALARRAIFENPGSPYRALLRAAGCEYGDLERLTAADGPEGACRALFRHGVYLTVDELKGRRPVVRGSTELTVDPARLRNPGATAQFATSSSGSRGRGTPVAWDFAFLRERAVTVCLVTEARGGSRWPKAVWGVPGGWGMVRILDASGCGEPPVRWFSQVDHTAPGLAARYRVSGWALRWGSLLSGVPLPRPQYVSLDEPLPIARWMAGCLRQRQTPHLQTFASAGVRVCQAALAAGVELRGAQFRLSGEPMTAARLAAIHQVGAEAEACYAAAECGYIGFGCQQPIAPDDLHLLHDMHVAIDAGADGPARGLEPASLLLTSLRATAPLVFLNVSLGDQAVLATRICGCPLQALGWTLHLSQVRSHEKLTAAGMNFLDVDVVRVLEEILPAKFGGAPTDYQLLEEETADGRPRLRLLVHPRVGALEPTAVADALLDALGEGAGAERVMALTWRGARLLEVERRPPLATSTGKILHLVRRST
jgi:hypothetical protein